jgi:hypothetical protein
MTSVIGGSREGGLGDQYVLLSRSSTSIQLSPQRSSLGGREEVECREEQASIVGQLIT